MYMTSSRRALWTFGYPCFGSRHDGTSDDQGCRPLEGARALDIKYGFPVLHLNDFNLRPFPP